MAAGRFGLYMGVVKCGICKKDLAMSSTIRTAGAAGNLRVVFCAECGAFLAAFPADIS